jgi:hypothetical protein
MDGYREYAAALQRAAAEQESQLPQRVEGVDPSRAVRVVIGPDGLPESVEVDFDWKRNLRPEKIAQAVQSAYQDAVKQRLRAFAGAMGTLTLPDPPAAGATVPPASPPPAAGAPVRPRRLEEIGADVVRLATDPAADPEAPPPSGSGATAYGKLTLTIATDHLTCTVDHFWAADQTGEELTAAFATALAAARADYAQAAGRSPVGRAQHLLDEVIAAMGALLAVPTVREETHG